MADKQFSGVHVNSQQQSRKSSNSSNNSGKRRVKDQIKFNHQVQYIWTDGSIPIGHYPSCKTKFIQKKNNLKAEMFTDSIKISTYLLI